MARTRAATFDQQRDAILALAARLFAERGYPAASIAQLAAAGGMSKALLYHYYRDKEQLLFDIADRYLDVLQAIVAEVEAESARARRPPAAHLRRLIERFMRQYEHAGAQHRVLVQDVKYLSATHCRRLNGKQRAVVDAFARAVAAVAPALSAAGLAKPVTMTLFGMVNWTFTWLKDSGAISYAQMAAVVADLFMGGVGRIASSPSAPDRRGRIRDGAARSLPRARVTARAGAARRVRRIEQAA